MEFNDAELPIDDNNELALLFRAENSVNELLHPGKGQGKVVLSVF